MKPYLYVIFGLPWSGKTTVAKYLATIWGKEDCVRISPDSIRKELFPVPKYDKAASWAIWEESVSRLNQAMTTWKIILWDAVFGHDRKRQEIAEKAKECGYDCFLIYISGEDENTIEQRLIHRVDDPSDADFEVYKTLKASFQNPIADSSVIRIENSAGLEELYEEVEKKILGK